MCTQHSTAQHIGKKANVFKPGLYPAPAGSGAPVKKPGKTGCKNENFEIHTI